ncbi:hypothetical protein [Coleofasciculus sp.]|uniref:hypothetical protein n=1 Tax=Coleofasciculus sp. TaxID=3100458 RepID=UPI003A2F5809
MFQTYQNASQNRGENQPNFRDSCKTYAVLFVGVGDILPQLYGVSVRQSKI